jgi:hypothetical protein
VARDFGVALSPSATKETQVETLSAEVRFPDLLRSLGRDELKAACRAHGLDDAGRARPPLMARLLAAHGVEAEIPGPAFHPGGPRRFFPEEGDIVQVRHRQWLVETTAASQEPGSHTRVALVCLDDDNSGRRLEVLWERELGARVLQPAQGLGAAGRLDAPRDFAAYYQALRWNAVTATESRLFQAPFRAGIQLKQYQLTPLKKALDLPRANLFIADDVGLGKTIEAGLVLQELVLRQRVSFVLILCPATLCLQWRDEMEKRFGLRFELFNREFVNRRRQERGFGVNPWATHNRFVISYQTLRRPEYREPLLRQLADRAAKSLLILDEAHTAAPATASRYAVDSSITHTVREVAARFENRLFLSATPHNGHSNSFSALLEILDPQRFTRGVPVAPGQLEAVMVRRLKSDLRKLGIPGIPERRVLEIALEHDGAAWAARFPGDAPLPLAAAEPFELRLSQLLAEYAALVQPRKKRGRLVFVNLQKRLLSSVEAFYRTLQLHARAVREGRAGIDPRLPFSEEDPAAAEATAAGLREACGDGSGAEYGPDETDGTEEDAALAAEIADASRRLPTPQGRALAILDEMLELAERYRAVPDAKALALVDWIRRHQCAAVRVGGAAGSAAERRWDGAGDGNGRRLLVFTEYADTKVYLRRILAAAFAGTVEGDRRLLEFHGGMSDAQREQVQRAFNSPPHEHPVRVLLATDAAREGVNLQGHCADLFHFDVPWNPARMEQRNGRIDRTLQESPEVRCHYFVYPQREEDRVLSLLVLKVERIRRELGSLSAVLMDRFAELLETGGIAAGTAADLEAAEQGGGVGGVGGKAATVREELEAERADAAGIARLRRETEEAGKILEDSRRVLDPDPALLREVVDIGLRWAEAAGPLRPADPPVDPQDPTVQVFELPAMPESWRATLDTLRPPRERGEPIWEHWKKPPLPVTFRPVPRLAGDRAHLHLQHPFVQRILARFLAQGYSAHDLARVTALRTPYEERPRVLAFGRLSLFGPGAVRLHDEIITVAALWLDGGGPGHLEPFADAAEREALAGFERLLRELPHQPGPAGDPFRGLPPQLRERLAGAAPGAFAALWPALREEADGRVHDAERKLTARGLKEAADLRRILETQKQAIRKTLGDQQQTRIEWTEAERFQREQFERDRQWMERRLADIDREIAHEPEQLRGLYRVVLPRLEPVGMVYLWPETR